MTKRILTYFGVVTLLFCIAKPTFAALVSTQVVVSVVPNAPTNLTATAATSDQVQLSWTDNSTGADGESIERKVGVSGTYVSIATTTADIATFIDNSTDPSTDYFYRVRSFVGTSFSDYSNEAMVTTPSAGGGGGGGSGGGGSVSVGGGGGGGGGVYIPPPATPVAQITNVVISGLGYPGGRVIVLKDGQSALQVTADSEGNFIATIGGLSGGNYNFSLYGEDSAGLRSATFTFSVTVTSGATTFVNGVYLSPTIALDKQEVKKGDAIIIFGQSAPSSSVLIQVGFTRTFFANTISTASGTYTYTFNTSPLAMGSYTVNAKSESGAMVSENSLNRTFSVGTQDIAAATSTCPVRGDLNGDCQVNLVDFSILAYWYGKPNFPAAFDLNSDGSIDLIDFSIMAYYWTG